MEPPRGRRVLLRGAPAAHARGPSRRGPARRRLPDVSARATRAAARGRARLHPARGLRAQLGAAAARPPHARRLGAALGALRRRVGVVRPERSRLLLPLPDQRDRFTWGPRYGPHPPHARHAPAEPGPPTLP